MAQNKLMHPRNIYKTPPDFKQLAIDYSEFRMHAIQDLSGKVNINFKDPNSLRALTRTLLKKDFGLDVEIPVDRLIPTVPQRLNYILWLEDLLKEDNGGNSVKRGIDIGTGASCVFPLLGCSKNGWNFVATESNQSSFDCATRNVLNNQLQDSVKVIHVSESASLQSLLSEQKVDVFDFCMCNPPFFCDSFDASWESKARKRNRTAPKGANTASPAETITEGGEIEFVKRIIDDSLSLKERVRIYTTMLGKKDSVSIIKEYLKEKKVPQFLSTEFQQGKTLRWGVAWTFCVKLKLTKIAIPKSFKPVKPLTFFVPSSLKCAEYSVSAVLNHIVELIKELDVGYHVYEKKETSCKLWMRTNANTWSHQRRKKRELLRQKMQTEHLENDHSEQASLCTSNDCRTNINNDLEQKVFDESTNHITASSVSKRKPTLLCFDDSDTSESSKKRANTDFQSNNSAIKVADLEVADVDNPLNHVTASCSKKKQTQLDSDNLDGSGELTVTVDNELNCSNSVDGTEGMWLLFADVNINLAGRCILLELKARKEMNSRETLHQIMQYLKNNLV